MEKKIYSLSSVAKAIENIINTHAAKRIWVKAEIVKLNYYKHSGHCYPDLVEKKNGRIVAEMRGNIWNQNFIRINNQFKSVLNEELKDNMTVVCLASVQFHPVYGLSLSISEIDPNYTLGEMARQKAETIQKLKQEQVFNLNKEKQLPILPKTIAVISVDTSKGFLDFTNVITNNPWGYQFHIQLFPAILQGAQSVSTITGQLQKIGRYLEIFDAVAIIRGGGGDIGLSSFDEYQLAKAVATYPIPVLSGIGHSTNETITEMVSWQSFITPTKIAEFLIQQFHNFSIKLDGDFGYMRKYAGDQLSGHAFKLKEKARLFSSLSRNYLQDKQHALISAERILANTAGTYISAEKARMNQMLLTFIGQFERQKMANFTQLQQLQQALSLQARQGLEIQKATLKSLGSGIHILSPEHILKRGFSITRLNGKVVKGKDDLVVGDEIETRIYDGLIKSKINKIN